MSGGYPDDTAYGTLLHQPWNIPEWARTQNHVINALSSITRDKDTVQGLARLP